MEWRLAVVLNSNQNLTLAVDAEEAEELGSVVPNPAAAVAVI